MGTLIFVFKFPVGGEKIDGSSPFYCWQFSKCSETKCVPDVPLNISTYNGPVTTPWQRAGSSVLFCSHHSFDNSIISLREPPQSRPPPITPPESEAGNAEGHRRQQNLSVQLRKLLSPWRICNIAILQSTASFCDVIYLIRDPLIKLIFVAIKKKY